MRYNILKIVFKICTVCVALSLFSCSDWGKFADWDDYKEAFGKVGSIDTNFGPGDDDESTNNDFYKNYKFKVICSGALLTGNRQVREDNFTLNIQDEAESVSPKYSDSLGVGDFSDIEKACARSIEHSFDSIAVGTGYRVTVYSGKDFTGEVLLEAVGPVVIYNVLWNNNVTFSFLSDILTQSWDNSGLQSVFPSSTRSWSATNMHDWKGSLKVQTN